MSLNACDPELQLLLKNKISIKTAVYAHLSHDVPGTDEVKSTSRNFLIDLGVDAEKVERWAMDCTDLHSTACG